VLPVTEYPTHSATYSASLLCSVPGYYNNN
jgi:hypothetical protein